jgi:hypothetical protein
MKKLTFGLLMLVAIISSCKKNDSTDTATTSGSATVSVSNYGFDGGTSGKFSSTKAGITQVTAGGITTFTISAIKDGSNESISIVVLQKITTTGRIALPYNGGIGGIIISKDYTKPADVAINYSTEKYSPNVKGGGEIVITKLDGNKVEGTFSGTAVNGSGAVAFVEQGTFAGTIQ